MFRLLNHRAGGICVTGRVSRDDETRVAIFLSSLRGGGAQRVMVTLANAFAHQGLAVDLVVVVAKGPYLKELSPSVRVIDLKARSVARSLPRLVAYLRRERPTSILTALTHVNVVALLSCMLAGTSTRVVVSERNTHTVEAMQKLGLLARFSYRLARWLYPRAAGIVAVSDGAAEALSKQVALPRGRITRIYNPADVADIQRQAREGLDHP